MKALIKRVVPNGLLRWAKMHREFRAERLRYSRYSGPDDGEQMERLRARHLEMQLTKEYHRLEKALTLPSPRTPYGAAARRVIDKLLPSARSAEPAASYLAHVDSAVRAQDAWNSSQQIDDAVAPLRHQSPIPLDHAESFFGSRHSVRNFAHRPVDRDLIDAAIRMASNTPSVCNRQPWRVRLFEGPADVRAALRFQNGNAGFGDTVPALLLVTVDIELFAGASERNQVFIEGGLFSMTLVWSLHALGLDSCMLNMSQSNSRLARARRALRIPEKEAIVMFIAVGYGSEGLRVARSPHRHVDELLLAGDTSVLEHPPYVAPIEEHKGNQKREDDSE